MPIITDLKTVTGQRKVIISFEPTFNTLDKEIRLRFYTVIQSEENGVWSDIPGTLLRRKDIVVIHNGIYLDPITELLVVPAIDETTGEPDTTGLVGAYDYLLSRTGNDLGMESLEDVVFATVAAKLEAFIETNGLHL